MTEEDIQRELPEAVAELVRYCPDMSEDEARKRILDEVRSVRCLRYFCVRHDRISLCWDGSPIVGMLHVERSLNG